MSLSSKVSQVNKGKTDLSDTLAFVAPLVAFLSDIFFYLFIFLLFHANTYTQHSQIPVLFIEDVFPKSILQYEFRGCADTLSIKQI